MINCQSLKSKKTSFENLVSSCSYDPDIFVGTESWLSSEIANNEIFLSGYTIYRRDHPDGYGGIFFGCRSSYTSISINMQTTCEICNILKSRSPPRHFTYHICILSSEQ